MYKDEINEKLKREIRKRKRRGKIIMSALMIVLFLFSLWADREGYKLVTLSLLIGLNVGRYIPEIFE